MPAEFKRKEELLKMKRYTGTLSVDRVMAEYGLGNARPIDLIMTLSPVHDIWAKLHEGATYLRLGSLSKKGK